MVHKDHNVEERVLIVKVASFLLKLKAIGQFMMVEWWLIVIKGAVLSMTTGFVCTGLRARSAS